MEWPPHSPDLNPIEHVWSLLKREIFKLRPELRYTGRSFIAWTEFHDLLKRAWKNIDQNVLDDLIRWMPRRIAAIRNVRGWYTKY